MKDVLGREIDLIPRTGWVKNGILHAKVCSRCGRKRDIAEFYVRRTPDGRTTYMPRCTECLGVGKRDNRRVRKTRRDKHGLLMLQCSSCGEFKHLVDFYYHRGEERFRCYCRKCYSIKRKKWQLKVSR